MTIQIRGDMTTTNGQPPVIKAWAEGIYREIDSLSRRFEIQEKRLLALQNDVTALKVKSGIWGSVAGLIVGGAVSILIKRL
jgi:hypothetical protein